MDKVCVQIISLMWVALASGAVAHQPVMDMAPRWGGGYGFQIRHEQYGSDTLLNGDKEVNNPLRLERYVESTWIEGVYTFSPAKRLTFKLPYINQRRTKNINQVGVKQRNRGWGDLILAMPLKHYWNRDAETGNFGFTPSLRLPTGGTSGEFPTGDGSWDAGFSFSFSKETPKHYVLVDLFYWLNTEGRHDMREGNEWGLDINAGYHPYHSNQSNAGVFVMWDVSVRDNESSSAATFTAFTGGRRIYSGPIVVLYRESVMFRMEYKMPVYERVEGLANSRGNELTASLGITF